MGIPTQNHVPAVRGATLSEEPAASVKPPVSGKLPGVWGPERRRVLAGVAPSTSQTRRVRENRDAEALGAGGRGQSTPSTASPTPSGVLFVCTRLCVAGTPHEHQREKEAAMQETPARGGRA